MRFLLLAAAIASASCLPALQKDEATLAAIARDASLVLADGIAEGDLPRDKWPKLSRLDRAYLRPEGLYLRTSKLFVSERGYFVPRQPVTIELGGDPSYELLGSGVYAYEIKG